VANVDLEAVPGTQCVPDGLAASLVELPGLSARRAVEVSVPARRQDVELLASVGAMAVSHEPQALESVERAVDGRRGRGRIEGSALLDEFGTRDVAVGLGQDVDECPALRRPAEAASAEQVSHVGPGDVHRGFVRSDLGHRAKA
jgi:hypothetical protein